MRLGGARAAKNYSRTALFWRQTLLTFNVRGHHDVRNAAQPVKPVRNVHPRQATKLPSKGPAQLGNEGVGSWLAFGTHPRSPASPSPNTGF